MHQGIRALDGDQKGDVGSPLGTPSTNVSTLDHEQGNGPATGGT